MKISLRQAHDIQNRILARVNEILEENESQIDILFEEQPHQALDSARDRNLQRMNRADVLINEIRDIRMSVSRLNQESGINDLLATISAEERKAQYRARLSRMRPREEERTIDRRIQSALAEVGTERYGRDSLDVIVYQINDLNMGKQLVRESDKRIRELKEQVLHLNVGTKFDLSPATVDVLTDEQIV